MNSPLTLSLVLSSFIFNITVLEVNDLNNNNGESLNETLSGNVADEFGPSDYPRLRYIHNSMDSYLPFESDLKNTIQLDTFFSHAKKYYNMETTRVARDKEYYLKDTDEEVGEDSINVKKIKVNITNNLKSSDQLKSEKFEYTDFTRIKNTILLKCNCLSNLYYFISVYVNDINSIFNKINELIFIKITYTLDQYKNYMKFFKEVIETYQKISGEMNMLNGLISPTINVDPIFEKVVVIFDKTQSSIAEHLNEFANNMNTNLLVNGPFYKIKELYQKMGSINKEIMANIGDINFERDRLKAKHTSNLKIFENFKNNYNDYDKVVSVLKKNDFFLLEFSFIKSFNKLIEKINILFQNYNNHINSLIKLISDFTLFLKESLQIYYNENNKVFTHYLDFPKIEKIFESISKEQVEAMFEPQRLLGEDIQTFEENLSTFQLNLLKFNFVKHDDLYQDENFKVSKYSSINDFVNFITHISPEKILYEHSPLLQHSWELKRDPGFFKPWKTCFIVLTLQNNILIYDEKIHISFLTDKLELKNCSLISKEDKKNPFRFELNEVRKGIIYNSNVTYYFDALNQETFDKILKVIDPKLLGKNLNKTFI